MKCLENIIGLSRTECECEETSIPEEDQVSDSGIYLDEVEGGLKISAIENIDCQDFVDKARQARRRAIDMFIEQIIGIYSSSPYKRRYKMFTGRIGKINTVHALATKRFAGLRLRTHLIRGAEFTITKIGMIITQEQNVTVQVYKAYRNDHDSLELVTEIEDIPTIAGITSTHTLAEPLVLPLYDDQLQPIDYFFVYDTLLYGPPKDNRASCTCGGMETILKTYMEPKGIQSDTINTLSTSSASMYANGIFIDGRIDCGIKEMICSLKNFDESNTIAHAIAYKAQELLIEAILSTGNINRYTMLAKEHLWGKRNHFRKEFDDRVIWLSQVVPIEDISDCLHCNNNSIRKVLIR